jgi:very-short-patch-repair endonuclease
MATTKQERRGKCPSNTEQHEHMAMRQQQNMDRAVRNPNENWMASILDETAQSWTRQARWGWRVFDFWCRELGVAIEVDGPEHRHARDSKRDDYSLRRSGILVIRVRNRNEEDAANALAVIGSSGSWWDRRRALGVPLTKAERGRDDG